MKLTINCDGGARGNPGPAGIGILINQNAKCKNIEISKYIGTATNNQAEYQAVIEALKYIDSNFPKSAIEADFLLDSQLVVEQLNGNYKIKNEGLKPLFWQIRELLMQIGGKVSFTHIRREQNAQADKLVNEAIDNSKSKIKDQISK